MASISFSALRVASELGHRQAGEEHLFVSWLDADLPPDQRRALDALGLSGDQARTALVATTADEDRRDPESGTMSGPTYHRARGRARRTRGASSVIRSRDGVLAWLWDDFGHAVSELEILGATPAAFVEALAAHGVGIPTLPLPEPDRRPWGERVLSR